MANNPADNNLVPNVDTPSQNSRPTETELTPAPAPVDTQADILSEFETTVRELLSAEDGSD